MPVLFRLPPMETTVMNESVINESLYPPTIQGVPAGLTIPSKAYRRQVVIVLLSLFVFIVFYLSLIVGSSWAVVYSILQATNATVDSYGHSNSGSYWMLAIVMGVLFLFLVKALFKWRKQKDEMRLEINVRQHPELFEFIRKICADTKAPFPGKVFLTPEVNAAVFYDSSVLSLIMPVKKNLLIGLGLVNGVNLSEFKAVIAHEFGHFSQSSMRLGSYVYMANRVIYDLVYQRDAPTTCWQKPAASISASRSSPTRLPSFCGYCAASCTLRSRRSTFSRVRFRVRWSSMPTSSPSALPVAIRSFMPSKNSISSTPARCRRSAI